MKLAEKMRRFDTTDFVKMYGFTLNYPQTIVIESLKLGSLDISLRNCQKNIKTVCLIDAAQTLAKALLYLVSFFFFYNICFC